MFYGCVRKSNVKFDVGGWPQKNDGRAKRKESFNSEVLKRVAKSRGETDAGGGVDGGGDQKPN
jgi:hypothetical protein